MRYKIEAVSRCETCDAGKCNYGITVIAGAIVCDICETPITSDLSITESYRGY